jgi:hypothetical protein
VVTSDTDDDATGTSLTVVVLDTLLAGTIADDVLGFVGSVSLVRAEVRLSRSSLLFCVELILDRVEAEVLEGDI